MKVTWISTAEALAIVRENNPGKYVDASYLHERVKSGQIHYRIAPYSKRNRQYRKDEVEKLVVHERGWNLRKPQASDSNSSDAA